MDNQHRKIKNYRELSQEEIDLMNEVKLFEQEVLELIDRIKPITGQDAAESARWLATGKTDLEKGFMSVVRAIAKPGLES